MNIFVIARCIQCGNVVAAHSVETIDDMASAASDGKKWRRLKSLEVSIERIDKVPPRPKWCECPRNAKKVE
jgi:hypothetical protein